MTSELQSRPEVGDPAPAPAGDRVVLRMHKDETGVIRYVDDVTTRVLGWQPEDLVGHRLHHPTFPVVLTDGVTRRRRRGRQ